MSTEQSTDTTKEARRVSRRTIVKGAAWSVPVIAAAAAAPHAAASVCNQPGILRGVGAWNINGPKGGGAGYVGSIPNNAPNGSRWFYAAGSVLPFTWNWTATSDPTGIIPAGTTFRVGLGGVDTLDNYWIQSFPAPIANIPAVGVGTPLPEATWGPVYLYTTTADIPAGTVITWTSTATLKNTIPAQEIDAANFGAYATIAPKKDSTACPPVLGSSVIASEWLPSSSTNGPGTYAIVSEYGLSHPGYYQP
ncbi:hypothetical protein [Microbacterium azadirachtae]|uniref:Uncharacterized protein n=1 Tax=Microbacterium azadirachtae TaxID=582680 RepID=A0A0F0LJ93_9MICO|nr:hypothetical protein [Microbacterium azadirachtae]KJL32734.1 hypothetical protein RS86_02516 [Microbacterium azadirachtae]